MTALQGQKYKIWGVFRGAVELVFFDYELQSHYFHLAVMRGMANRFGNTGTANGCRNPGYFVPLFSFCASGRQPGKHSE